jgi:class 3 adenylate cyclase
VADDVPDTVRLIQDVLTISGYQVVTARNGLEAIERVRTEVPDLLILDITMPKMNGFEVCRLVKADPNISHIPVLILSALEEVRHRVKGLELGADDYLIKPFRPDELVARVEARLRVKWETDALRLSESNLRETFQRYVAPTVVERLLNDPSAVALGGDRRDITVLFADISGFTHLSEQVAPEQAMRILNDYLTLAGQAVLDQEGTLDKFTGDAVMAIFNAPLYQRNHPLRAVRAAIEIRRRLADYHCNVTPDGRLHCKVGICSGESVVGNAGMPNLMNYTAIGDSVNVNVAKRLEETAEPDQILISADTYEQVRNQVIARRLGLRKVKGRDTNVLVYELLNLDGNS